MRARILRTGQNVIDRAREKGLDLDDVMLDEGDDESCPDDEALPLRFAAVVRFYPKKRQDPSLSKAKFVRGEKQIIKSWIKEDREGIRSEMLEPG